MVLVNVPAELNASFYVAWSVTMIAFLVPATIGQVLLVEASRARNRWAHIRTAGGLSLGVMGLASLAGWARPDVITSLFGSGYRPAAQVLPRLLAAGIPWAITSVALADARVRGDSRGTLAITLMLAFGVLVPATLLVPKHGITGASEAWLGGHLITAALATLVLVGGLRGEPPGAHASIP
jgi:O-antigen/teichoic acid export membrane protein